MLQSLFPNKYITFILFLGFVSFFLASAYSQEAKQQDKIKIGSHEMYEILGNNLNYPLNARNNLIYGTTLVQLGINKNGKLTSIKFLNYLGFGFEENLYDVYSKHLNNWEALPNDTIVIQPIRFTLQTHHNKYVELSKTCKSCLELMIITGHDNSTFINYSSDLKSNKIKYEKAMTKEKYEVALKHLTKLIQIDVFCKQYYLDRIKLEDLIGKYVFKEYDEIILKSLFDETVQINN